MPTGTIADVDVCRWECLLTGMFATCRWTIFLLTSTFADWDVCQRGHLPMGTFANMDVCLPTWTFPNWDFFLQERLPTAVNWDVCLQGSLSTGMFADGDVCHLLMDLFLQTRAFADWDVADRDICQWGHLPTWTFPNWDFFQQEHLPTGANWDICLRGCLLTDVC